jgi:hypothetical protein
MRRLPPLDAIQKKPGHPPRADMLTRLTNTIRQKMKKVYSMPFACLDCRKVFKKPRYELGRAGTWESIDQERICPQCGMKLIETGMAFKAPKQTDIKAWERLAQLFRSGYRFNPDFGDPFEEPVAEKRPRPRVPKSEFRKSNRKRTKSPNKSQHPTA